MKLKVAMVVGRFNVLHPGHIRLLKFAKDCADRLVVAVESDRLAGFNAHISETLRLQSIQNCSIVDESFIFDEPVSDLICRLRPQAVIKGKEHEKRFNPEAAAIASYGGRLIFSSGEAQLSATDLLRRELISETSPLVRLPQEFMARHGISRERLRSVISAFAGIRVMTIGDLIIDEYIDCEPLGMSQEDPTIVVSPIRKNRFLGGAGIVAAHAAGLGAVSHLISITGKDNGREFSLNELNKLKINATLLLDESRLTTLKERYRSRGKTLLRVSHLHQSTVPLTLQDKLIKNIEQKINEIDLLIFSDFNYGVLPQRVVDSVIALARENKKLIAADSQSSSQLGDIGRFRGVDLLLPTEHEARVSVQNQEHGLVVLAEQLRQKSNANYILLKLGEDGVLIHAPSGASNVWITDQVEALNKSAKDVAGAGDSMLVSSALTLAVGGNIWEAASIGSMAAAIQVNRVGNHPVTSSDLVSLLG